MTLTRQPAAHLRRFVSLVWATCDGVPPRAPTPREHVLPTGAMHLVFRLSGPPLRLFRDSADNAGHTVGFAIVGGARSAFHVRDVSVPAQSVGAQLLPGASMALFGVPADELAGRHTPLDALWGAGAEAALMHLHEAETADFRLRALEALLDARLVSARPPHPAVAQALRRLPQASGIRELVCDSGYSHRRLIALFRAATSLSPKAYARVARFQQLLSALEAQPQRPWAQLAQDTGYSDQAHLSREFMAMAGLTPQAWRRASPRSSRHVPVSR